jgi:two-component system LytT family sensor kinase
MTAAGTGSVERRPSVERERWWLTAYRRPRWWVGVFALWTAFGILMVGHVQARFGGQPAFVPYLFTIVPFYWAWVPLMPLVVELAVRWDFGPGRRARSLAGHLGGAVFVIVLHGLLYAVYRTAVPLAETGDLLMVLVRTLQRHATGDLATYAVVVGALVALQAFRRAERRERELDRIALRASQLEARLSTARLEALQMQLRPHFLFNALNTISVLVLKGEGRDAIRAIRRLADLLRDTLRTAATPERSLQEEVAFAREYLVLEQLRFGDRLRVEIDLPADAASALVPHLILQPLIENAVIHGLGPSGRSGGGRLRIAAGRRDGMLHLEVLDNGAGLDAGGARAGGVGLANTRQRLHELYGERARLDVAPAEDGGTVAAIDLPYRAAVAAGVPAP